MAISLDDLKPFPKEWEADLKTLETAIDKNIKRQFVSVPFSIDLTLPYPKNTYPPRVYDQLKKNYEEKGWEVELGDSTIYKTIKISKNSS